MSSKALGWACGLTLIVVPLAVAAVGGQSRQKPAYATWSDYGGAADSMQYSALKQIDKSNVNRLELAWFYPVPDRKGNFGFNPIVVDNLMYLLGPGDAIVAV